MVSYLEPDISDHSPFLVRVREDSLWEGRPFRFFNYMASHPDFLDTMKSTWPFMKNGNLSMV